MVRVRMSCGSVLAGVGASMRAVDFRTPHDAWRFVCLSVDDGGSFVGVGAGSVVEWRVKDIESSCVGSVLLPPREVQAFLGTFDRDDWVTIEGDVGLVLLRCRSAYARFRVPDAGLFPPRPSEPGRTVGVPRDQFLGAYACASRAVGQSGRYALDAVMIEPMPSTGRLAIVGTDSRHLICTEVEVGLFDGPSALVPKGVWGRSRWAKRGDDVLEYGVTSRHAVLRGVQTTVWATLNRGRYPDWRTLFPARYEPGLAVKARLFLDALRSAAAACPRDLRRVEVAVGPGEMVISSGLASAGVSSVTIPVEGYAEPFRLFYDSGHVIRLIQCFLDDDGGGGGGGVVYVNNINGCLYVRGHAGRYGVVMGMVG